MGMQWCMTVVSCMEEALMGLLNSMTANFYYDYYIHRQSLQSTQKKEGRKGAQTLEKQGKKQPTSKSCNVMCIMQPVKL
jgi:hypothetical protein